MKTNITMMEGGVKADSAQRMSSGLGAAAKRFALAGALGMAVLLGSQSAEAQDAGVPDARPAATVQNRASQLSSTADTLRTSGQSLFSADLDVAIVASNWLAVNELRELLLNAPSSSDPKRPAYDHAVSVYGSRDAALTAATSFSVNGLAALRERARASADFGDSTAAMVAALGRRDQGVGEGDANYSAFDSGDTVACLKRLARGGEACTEAAGPRVVDPRISNPDVPLIEFQPMMPSSLFLLNGINRPSYVVVDGGTTTTLNSLFGGQGNAQSAVNSLANAYATLANYPNDPTRQAQAGRALHDALATIPGGREIWNRPQFNAAMSALARGDLRGGLDALSRETALNGIYQNLSNIHQLSMSPLAVARYRLGLHFRFPERDNIQEFLDYRRSSDERRYAWDVLHYDLGLNYTNLLLSFSDQLMSVNPSTNTLVPLVAPIRLEGEGHALDLMGGVTWGGSMFKQPVESTISGRLGFLWWNVNHGFVINGNRQVVDVSGNQPYGELRFNVDFVGYEGRTSAFRLQRAGIGMFDLYPFAYFTLAQRWYQSNSLRLETTLTPQYQFFWGHKPNGLQDDMFYQNRISADLRPLDFSIQASRSNSIYFGPGFWYNYSARTDENFWNGIHTMEPYVHVAWRNARGVMLDARVGYIFDLGGDESYHIPNTLTGTLNLVLTPALWGSQPGGSISGITRAEVGGSNMGVQASGGLIGSR